MSEPPPAARFLGQPATLSAIEGLIERTHLDGDRIFGGVADDYERGRPTYPEQAIEWLALQAGLDGHAAVVDLGSGTGKLTRLLTPRARAIAIDPDPVMLSTLRREVPEAHAVCARAESIPLRAGSVDAVTAAQCFDWFGLEEALREIHRILRPRGILGVVFNSRADDVNAVFMGFVARHCGKVTVDAEAPWQEALAHTDLFTTVGEYTTRFEHPLDVDGVVSLAASISYLAALPHSIRRRVLDDVRALASQHSGKILVPYTCYALALRST